MAVSIQTFEKALEALKEALAEPKTPMNRDATIQRFEFCVELAWKTAKKTMGTSTSAPKEVIREMAQNSLIDSVEPWFDAIEQRNLSSHSYNESIAEEVYKGAQSFLPHANNLLQKLKSK